MITDDNHSVSEDDNSVEVMKSEESRKEETAKEEWKRNPRIEVPIIPWRRIVGDHRRTFFIVVVIDHPWTSILIALWRLAFSVFASFSRDR